MTNPERYYVQRRPDGGSVLRWDRGTYIWAIDYRRPQPVTRDRAEALAAEHGGHVAEVTP